jgi:hypothetical protein
MKMLGRLEARNSTILGAPASCRHSNKNRRNAGAPRMFPGLTAQADLCRRFAVQTVGAAWTAARRFFIFDGSTSTAAVILWFDVLIKMEKILRIILLLNLPQTGVIGTIGRLYTGALLLSHKINVGAF